MRMRFPLMLLVPGLLVAEAPLQVAQVVRLGPPPYEDGARLYRLEGDGCLSLRVNEKLSLRRGGERRNLGRLQVQEVKDGYALARLAEAGETYPLRGDRVVRVEQALGLPDLPSTPAGEPLAPPSALSPRRPQATVPASLAKGRHREPLFFPKGRADLSPAGQEKLRAWVKAWGLDGRWVLLVPPGEEGAGPVGQARVEVLRGALAALGVKGVDVQPDPAVGSGRYDSIHVGQDPW